LQKEDEQEECFGEYGHVLCVLMMCQQNIGFSVLYCPDNVGSSVAK
jgi:hypothetical protein